MPKPEEVEEVPRSASSPIKGSMREVVRTFVAFVVAFAFTWLGGKLPAVELAGVQEGILAFAGKAFRNSGLAVGKIL